MDAKTKTPILFVNNVYDPATGYSNAQRAERLLGNAVLRTVASYGHPSYQLPSKCPDKWRVRYLVPSVRLLSRQVGLRSRIRRKAFH